MTNDRQSLFAPFLEQLNDASLDALHQPAVSLLTERGFLDISGPDSSKFLQGQLSNNLDNLATHQHHLSTGCTPKGRMYSAFRMLNTDGSYLLSMHEGLLEPTQTTLGKYAVFFKADPVVNDSMVALGLSGTSIQASIQNLFGNAPEDHTAIQVADHIWLMKVSGQCERYELWLPADQLATWWKQAE